MNYEYDQIQEYVDERSSYIKCIKVKKCITSINQFFSAGTAILPIKQCIYKKYISIYMLNFLAVCEVDSQTQQFFVQFSDIFSNFSYIES